MTDKKINLLLISFFIFLPLLNAVPITVDELASLEFKVYERTDEELKESIVTLFKHKNFLTKFKFPEEKLRSFMNQIHLGYSSSTIRLPPTPAVGRRARHLFSRPPPASPVLSPDTMEGALTSNESPRRRRGSTSSSSPSSPPPPPVVVPPPLATTPKVGPNKYHNFHHAINTLQMVHYMLQVGEAAAKISDLHQFALYLAALGHDIDHPGVTNNFFINEGADLALLYNDVSVLENHHASYTFRILNKAENDVLEGLNYTDYREVRALMINSILMTDMARHSETPHKYNLSDTAPDSVYLSRGETFKLCALMLHAADCSGQARPFEIAEKFEGDVSEEFAEQDAMEEAYGLPRTVVRVENRGLPKDKRMAKGAVGFIGFVGGMYDILKDVLPKTAPFKDNMDRNLAEWTRRLP